MPWCGGGGWGGEGGGGGESTARHQTNPADSWLWKVEKIYIPRPNTFFVEHF